MQEPEYYIQCSANTNTGECEGTVPLTQWCFEAPVRPGDSGGPVWIDGTNTAVGITSSGSSRTCAAALMPDPRFPNMAAVFGDPSMGALQGITTSLTGG